MENSTKEVWIIDDDRIFQLLTARMIKNLASIPVNITQFYDGQEAMEFLESNPAQIPDFVLLDINMPVVNGFDFLELISIHHVEVAEKPSIYIVTSSIDKTDKKKASSYTFVKDFLVKPLSEETIKTIFS